MVNDLCPCVPDVTAVLTSEHQVRSGLSEGNVSSATEADPVVNDLCPCVPDVFAALTSKHQARPNIRRGAAGLSWCAGQNVLGELQF